MLFPALPEKARSGLFQVVPGDVGQPREGQVSQAIPGGRAPEKKIRDSSRGSHGRELQKGAA